MMMMMMMMTLANKCQGYSKPKQIIYSMNKQENLAVYWGKGWGGCAPQKSGPKFTKMF